MTSEQQTPTPRKWTEDPRAAVVYDVECAGRSDHAWFLTLARELGSGRVTDLGAGTGTLALELAAAGHDVTAVEPASAMIDRARSKPGADAVVWVHGYADALREDGADLVVMEAHVAQYFTTDEAWDEMLGHLHRHLRPGGHLAFDCRNPGARAWEGWTPEATRATYPHPDGGEFVSWVEVEAVEHLDGAVGGEPRGPVETHRGHTVLPDGTHLSYPETLRFRTLAELTDGLGRAGFDVVRVHGDWDGSPVTAHSPEHLVLARRV